MKESFFKKLQPHLIAAGIFLLITLVYFSPLFQGKGLEQHDTAQWIGGSKSISDFRDKTGIEPLWADAMFSGMPAFQISVIYADNLVQYLNDIVWLGIPTPANLLFVCLMGFYLLMISLRADYRLAIAGAIAYAFCSYFFVIIQAGHNTKANAIAYMPMVIAGILMAYRGRFLIGGIITAVALSLEIYANHLQITYYLAIAIFLLVICEAVQAVINKKLPDFLKASITLGAAVVLAVLPNVSLLWSTYDYGQYSTRGPSELTEKKSSNGLDLDYATSWSYGKLETLTLLFSDFSGGSSHYQLGENSETYKALVQNSNEQQAKSFIRSAPLYWGAQPSTSGPVYNGAIIIFLFVLGMLLLRGYMKWWLVAVTVLSIMLAWGKNFPALTEFFFAHFPAYNKFRAVSMILVLASFALPLAAMLAVMKFTDNTINKDKLVKWLKYSLYICGGVCLVFLLVPGLFCDFHGPADQQFKEYDWLLSAMIKDRESILRMDAFRSLFFIALTFGMLWFWTKGKIQTKYLYVGLAVFIMIDMWPVDKRYLNNSNFTSKSNSEIPFEKTSADEFILQDTTYYRVINTTADVFSDASTSYFHKSIGGYHGAKLKRYQELIEYQISKGNMNVLNMLNTKYFIVRNQQDQTPMPQVNPNALGNAWFVNEWKIVPNADAEMKEMDSLNTKTTAVIDKRFEEEVKGMQPGMDSTSFIKLISYAPNDLKYSANTSRDQLAVFSEIYYPAGWNAYLDNKPVPHVRADYVLRALKVPAGQHQIEFKFEPMTYYTGEKISLAGSIILFLLVIAGIVISTKGNKHATV